jgi:hypothetical protein
MPVPVTSARVPTTKSMVSQSMADFDRRPR